MIPFRVIRSGLLLAGLLATLGLPAGAAEVGFTATLSAEEKLAAGLTTLTDDELAALDDLVTGDLARARQLKTSALPGRFTDRHLAVNGLGAGLDRLTPEQRVKLDGLVDAAIYNRPQPKERPRLKDGDLLSEQGRLRVHGGMSFTYGWAGGGRNFRESSAWVSYYDPVSGLGLAFGFSNYSGDAFPRYYPDYYSDRAYRLAAPTSYYSATPRTYFTDLGWSGESRGGFAGDGGSLRRPWRAENPPRHWTLD